MGEFEYTFLDGLIPILVIDTDIAYHTWYQEAFGAFEFYKLVCVSGQAEAFDVLKTNTRFHCIISDFEQETPSTDEYAILKEYAETIPCMVVSSRDSLERGFAISNYGALAIELKPISDTSRFMSLVNKLFLDNLLAPGHSHLESDYLKHYISVFNKYYPNTVESWSEHTGLPAQFLIRNWEREFGVHPKHIVCLHTLFRAAIQKSADPLVLDVYAHHQEEFLNHSDFYRSYLLSRPL